MDIYRDILVRALSQRQIEVTFPGLSTDGDGLVRSACCTALREIRDIVRNQALSDPECFQKIEAIVTTLEELGLSCDGRHDW